MGALQGQLGMLTMLPRAVGAIAAIKGLAITLIDKSAAALALAWAALQCLPHACSSLKEVEPFSSSFTSAAL